MCKDQELVREQKNPLLTGDGEPDGAAGSAISFYCPLTKILIQGLDNGGILPLVHLADHLELWK
jgi:hypothetical protein